MKQFLVKQAELREHRVKCHSNRPFARPRCPHRSKTQDKLDRHLVRHVARDAFRCEHCGKTFAFKNSLKKHLVSTVLYTVSMCISN